MQILMFGGELNGEMSNQLLSMNTNSLKVSVTEVNNTRGMLPCARKGHGMQYWPKHDALLLISGRNIDAEFLSDLHLYFLERDFWLCLATSPKHMMRHNFGVALYITQFTIHQNLAYLFGGLNQNMFASNALTSIYLQNENE